MKSCWSGPSACCKKSRIGRNLQSGKNSCPCNRSSFFVLAKRSANKMSLQKNGCMNMNILHIYNRYLHDSQGGLEQSIYQICIATGSLGCRNRILTLGSHSGRKEIARDEALVISYERSAEIASCGFSWSLLKNFSRECGWAEVIHYHYPWPFADLLHVLHRMRTPSLLTYHSDIVRQKLLNVFYSPLRYSFLSMVDRIVATSDNYAASSRVLAGYRKKVSVIPLGIDPGTYPDIENDRLRDWEQKIGRDFFLFVGVLRYYKGLHILMEAVRKAPFTTVIAGSGPLKSELERKATRLGLRNIVFLGSVGDKDKIALLQLCRAVVFPSFLRSEAFGMTLLEGLMLGKPLISCRIKTGTDYVNQDGLTGLVVEPGDPVALRRAMDYIFENKSEVAKFSRNARKRFQSCFNAKKMGQEYLRLYQNLQTKG